MAPFLDPKSSSPSLSGGEEVQGSMGSGGVPIAVVGVSFRGPADATSVEKLWSMIAEKREAWSQIPEKRWNNKAFYHPDHSRHGTSNVRGGHFFEEDLSLFDAPFFNMSSAEAAALDPQQRLLLEGTFEALENGGITMERIIGSKTSCFVGSFSGDYTDMLVRDPDCVPMYQCTNAGQSRAITANRVSYFFDLKGPSVTVDTACSGSLVALHLACQSLRTGDARCAVAAGVNTILSHEFMTTMSMMKFLSPDGRCYTFDERANGYARGEGVGCLILKPLHDALRDGDTIRAVIRGSGSNQDGRTSGITLPSAVSQEALIRDVYASAGLLPSETEYVEAHGTGTQAGDPLETSALSKVFGLGRDVSQPLRIGSIKTNVGHLEGASGIAGVIKAILMLENRIFLPNRNFQKINPRIPLQEWNLKVQLEVEPWDTPGPHRASVNSFGYGGSNAHVILEDASGYLGAHGLEGHTAPALVGEPDKITEKTRLFLLSAFDEHSGKQQAENLRSYLNSSIDLAQLAFTLNERRTKFGWRSVVSGQTHQELEQSLKNATFSRVAKMPTIGFVFTGQGAQWCGMGKELLDYRIFADTIDRIGSYLKSIGAPFDVRDEITKDPKDSRIGTALLSQPMCSAVQIALVNLFASWGIRPASVTGHSSGEIAAAYAMRALNEEDAIAVAYYRGVAASNMTKHGAMMAVGMSADKVQPYLDALASTAVVACSNSPTSVTISGDVTAINELKEQLDAKEIFARKLAVEVAYHSHHMELVSEEYLRMMAQVQPKHGGSDIEFYSSVTGAQASAVELGSEYWVSNMLNRVKFDESLRQLCFATTSIEARNKSRKTRRRAGAAVKASVDLLVEVGPHSALSGPIKQIIKADEALQAASIAYYSALIRNRSATKTVLDLVAKLVESGYPVDLSQVNSDDSCTALVSLPPYPWNHTKSFWAEPRVSKVYRNRKYPGTDLLGVPDRYASPHEPRWRNFLRATEIPWMLDHKIQSNIVYPAAGYIAMAIEAAFQHSGLESSEITGYTLREVVIGSALVVDEQTAPEVSVSLRARDARWLEFNVYSVSGDNRWSEHASGLVQVHKAALDVSPILEMDHVIGLSKIDTSMFYEQLSGLGLDYGPTFANMTKAAAGADICYAEITVPDIAAVMPMEFQHPHVVHPATLDSTFHPIFAALSGKDPAVPVSIEELHMSNLSTTPGDILQVQVKTERQSKTDVAASIEGRNQSGSGVLWIKNLKCRVLAKPDSDQENEARRFAYKFAWEQDPDLLDPKSLSFAAAPEDSKIQDDCEAAARHYIAQAISAMDGKTRTELYEKQWSYLQRVEPKIRLEQPELERVRASGPEGSLVCAIGEKLDAIFTGSADPWQIMTADGKLEAYWNETPRVVGMYQALAKYLCMIGHQNPHMSVLEVGAGTGGATLSIMEALCRSKPLLKRYTVTDPDSALLKSAEEKLGQWTNLVKFKELDFGGDLEEQGFGLHSQDVIIIPHGLHGRTKATRTALRSLKKLLADNGRLILVDTVQSEESVARAMVEGFRPSWWEDGSNHCFGVEEWNAQLQKEGFCAPKVLAENGARPGYELGLMVTCVTTEPAQPEEVLVVADNNELTAYLLSHLQFSSASLLDAVPNGKKCIVLDLGTPILADTDAPRFEAVKRICQNASGVLWVSRGGVSRPDAALISGFARTVRSEGSTTFVTLDLDGDNPSPLDVVAVTVASIFKKTFIHRKTEPEYSERRGRLLIPRLKEFPEVDESVQSVLSKPVPIEQDLIQPLRPLRAIRDRGTVFFEETTAVSEVTIELKACGLTKRDIGETILGVQCSGIVKSIASSVVDFAVGDRVCCLGVGTLCNFYSDKSSVFQKLPHDLSFESAASLAPYCAAYYAVHHLAKVTRNDRVLINGTADPCGQALLDFCSMIGCTLLTAREDLPATYSQASKADFIFNLLPTDLRLAWSCIAPHGHLVDFSGENRLDLPRKNASFTEFDINSFIAEKPARASEMLRDVICLLRAKAIPAPSVRTFAVSELENALAAGPGTAVIMRSDSRVKAMPEYKRDILTPDASYLLVGGLGGLGRAVASWMIEHGASHIIIVNRSGLSRQESKDVVAALQTKGAKVAVYGCDVASEQAVNDMASQAAKEMPPIRGVIQGAMVLKDSLLEKLSMEDYQATLYPKLRGCWNLHNALPKDMDFFLMESSISGVIGNAAQSAYAAGSTFMDAFAAYRNSLGLPAVTLDLGVITGIGYLSENKELAAAMQKQGFEGTDERTLLALIRSAILSPRRQGGDSQVVTGLGTWNESTSLGNFDAPLFSHFRRLTLNISAEDIVDAAKETRDRLGAVVTLDDAAAVVFAALAEKVAGRLQMPVENISSDKTISEYGVDSLVAVEIRNWISKELKSTVPLLEILANVSMLQLAGKIASRSELVKISNLE